MIFTGPIVIGAVVGAASAYLFKGNTIKEWIMSKSSNGIFKKKNQQEATELEVKIDEMPESGDKVEEIEWVDKENRGIKDIRGESDEGVENDVQGSATEKAKEVAESIKKKSAEALENTTKKTREAMEMIKEKTTVALEETTEKAKEAAEVIKEKTREALENTTKKMKDAIESFKKKSK